MSKMIEVPDPLYDEVQEDAEAHGLSLVGWIASKLPPGGARQSEASAQAPRTMAERLAGRLGRIGSGTGRPVSGEEANLPLGPDGQPAQTMYDLFAGESG